MLFLFFFHVTGPAVALGNLRNRNTFSHQNFTHVWTLASCHASDIFRAIPDYHSGSRAKSGFSDFSLYLKLITTFNFNTSTRRSQLRQHFISFELSSCKLMRMLWLKNLIFHSFWLKTFFFAVKPELCSHHTVGILQCYISCSDC